MGHSDQIHCMLNIVYLKKVIIIVNIGHCLTTKFFNFSTPFDTHGIDTRFLFSVEPVTKLLFTTRGKQTCVQVSINVPVTSGNSFYVENNLVY